MQIKQKLDYPIWKVPYFCMLGLFVLIKRVKVPALTNLINTKRPNIQKYGTFHIG